ncbi:MAG TPA: 4Fe-4S dicluster domain-containing protein [Firmicutes bacterium]|nr:4Fe-4S dicluster domain-containing protein [Bacillota bacterium]
MTGYFNFVRLDREKCKGCVNCIKKCPTEAIRVRQGKAEIIEQKCIDCGECIRACPNKAKYVETDSTALLQEYKYRIALPSPSLYGQFRDPINPVRLLTALRDLGFDDAFEVAVGAEVVAAETKRLFQTGKLQGPVISSACPAVVRLIQVRFPELTSRILPLAPPSEVAAHLARYLKARELGIPEQEIGIFYLTPCSAKVTSIKAPVGGIPSFIDGAFSIQQLYPRLSHLVKQVKGVQHPGGYSRASGLGIGFGISGGEQAAVGLENQLVADGIASVIDVLEELEMGHLDGIDYIEARACSGGCVGGILNVVNGHVARARLDKIIREQNRSSLPLHERFPELDRLDYKVPRIHVEPRPMVYLDSNINGAMAKMTAAEKILKKLPGLDCGACGAPNCKALAEDIVLGKAEETNCIFILRERIMTLGMKVYNLAGIKPLTLSLEDLEKEGEE